MTIGREVNLNGGRDRGDQISEARDPSPDAAAHRARHPFSIPVTVPEVYSAQARVAGLVEGLDQIPAHPLRSVIVDLSAECQNWREIAATYDIDCSFCDPHSPWQRRQIENLNRNGAGGCHSGPTSPPSHQPPRITPPPSSTGNADAASTARAPPASTLTPPCSDR